MLLSLLFALACPPAQALSASGLQENESLQVLAPTAAIEEGLYWTGRVHDAITGLPIAGAQVETWSEEIDFHYAGHHRFAASTTGRDGRFVVLAQEGERRADKLRIAAPGYVTWTEAAPSGPIALFPAPATPLRLAFEDMQGRPIEGVRVTSTYTCAHDITAIDVRSDASGIATLESWHWQESLPELRFQAAGFRAVKYAEIDPLLDQGRPLPVVLQRQAPCAFRLLDDDGIPRPGIPLLVQEGDGHHVLRTDEQGEFVVTSPYGGDEFNIEEMTPAGTVWIDLVAPIPGRVTPVRRNGEDFNEVESKSPIAIEGTGVPWSGRLHHEAGWHWEGEWKPFPTGKAILVTGTIGQFSPPLHGAGDSTRRGRYAQLRLPLVENPVLELPAMESKALETRVEAGGSPPVDAEAGPISVAAGPVAVMRRTEDAILRWTSSRLPGHPLTALPPISSKPPRQKPRPSSSTSPAPPPTSKCPAPAKPPCCPRLGHHVRAARPRWLPCLGPRLGPRSPRALVSVAVPPRTNRQTPPPDRPDRRPDPLRPTATAAPRGLTPEFAEELDFAALVPGPLDLVLRNEAENVSPCIWSWRLEATGASG
ncbi:MAG: hypothetical protein R3F17_01820 [Planctomycetota bacterium]